MKSDALIIRSSSARHCRVLRFRGARPRFALANCDLPSPTTGQTVTCTTAAPNPDTTGVQAVVGSTNVTVNVQPGAGISVVRTTTPTPVSVQSSSQVFNNGAISLTGGGAAA